jgi:hypothetical protein
MLTNTGSDYGLRISFWKMNLKTQAATTSRKTKIEIRVHAELLRLCKFEYFLKLSGSRLCAPVNLREGY